MKDMTPEQQASLQRQLEEWPDEIIGVRVDEEGNPMDIPEEEHFYVCSACGQAVDKRRLRQVFHHEVEGHEPLPTN